jgi:hypothetical protein
MTWFALTAWRNAHRVRLRNCKSKFESRLGLRISGKWRCRVKCIVCEVYCWQIVHKCIQNWPDLRKAKYDSLLRPVVKTYIKHVFTLRSCAFSNACRYAFRLLHHKQSFYTRTEITASTTRPSLTYVNGTLRNKSFAFLNIYFVAVAINSSFNTQTMHIKSFSAQQHFYVPLKTLYPGGIQTPVFSFLRRMLCPLRHVTRANVCIHSWSILILLYSIWLFARDSFFENYKSNPHFGLLFSTVKVIR